MNDIIMFTAVLLFTVLGMMKRVAFKQPGLDWDLVVEFVCLFGK